MAEVKWTDAQLQAIETRDCNLLVSAAAGSGKTAVLVERVIRMVTRAEDPIDLSSLLIMTFTRAAAAQMKGKIYRALREKLQACETKEAERLRQQLMKVQNARICTIDSLCLDIVREHFEDIDLDPGFRIADEAEINMLKKDVLESMLEECYAQGEESFLDVVQYYMDKNDRKLEEILLTLYRYAQSHPEPEAWLRAAAYPYRKARALFAGEDGLHYPEGMTDWMDVYVRTVRDQLEEVRHMAEAGIRISRRNYGPAPYEDLFRDVIRLVEDMDGQAFDYRSERLKEFLDQWKTAPRISTKNGEVDEELKEAASDLRKEIKKRLEDLRENFLYDDLESVFREMAACAPVAQTITDLAIRFSRALAAAKKEKNIADFSDIAHYALQVLIVYDAEGNILRDENGEPVFTRTADQMASELREIVVDEYQDTNLLQEYMVKALSGERFGRPDVFMVGDVKQSIYGFRMACPDLFNEKMARYQRVDASRENAEVTSASFGQEALGMNGSLILLDRNFRSRKEILALTNRVFQDSMVPGIGGINYRDGHALVYGGGYEEHDTASLSSPVPELVFLQGSGEQARYLEAYEIASRMESLVQSGRYHFSDMVILTRTSDNPALEEVLYQRGIPVLKNSGKGFFASLEVRLVLNLLQIIDNPYQDIPFAAVLYSPLCSASADDLARVRLAGGEKDYLFDCLRSYVKNCKNPLENRGNQTAETSGKFQWLLDRLSVWRQRASDMGICDFIEYVLEDCGLYHILSAMPQGEERRANLEFLKSRAAAFARGSYTGLYQFVRYMKELQDSDMDFGTANGGTGAEAVRMMTIHRSKGLEFPVVFLACTGKRFNETDLNASIIPDRELGLGLEKRDPESRMVRKTVLMQTIRRKQKISTYAEEMRLLYVAMTRAKEQLIITGADRQLESKIRTWDREKLLAQDIPETYQIMGAGSYLQLLGLTLHRHRDGEDAFRLSYLEETEAEEMRAEELLQSSFARETLREMAERDMDIDALSRDLDYRYPYEKAARMQGKLSASQMENREEIFEQKEVSDLPGMTRAGKGDADRRKQSAGSRAADGASRNTLTGADRGNAYHRFFELLDYQMDPAEQLEMLIAQGKISREYADAIDTDCIRKFMESDLGQRMARAFQHGQLFREQQFVMGYLEDVNKIETRTGPAVYSDVPDEELLLMQGIIDAWFPEDNDQGETEIVLVDYKTDRVAQGSYYVSVYAPQLMVYADALERSTPWKVKEMLIYSVELGRAIPVR